MLKNIQKVFFAAKIYLKKIFGFDGKIKEKNGEKAIEDLSGKVVSFKIKKKIYSKDGLNYILKTTLVFSVIITSIGITSGFTKNNALAVYVNDRPIGIIGDTNITENQLSSEIVAKLDKENETKTSVSDKISLVPVIARDSDISTEYEIISSIKDNIVYNIDSYTISVNGNNVVSLKTKSEAEDVLEKIKSQNVNNIKGFVSAEFADDIKVYEQYNPVDSISSYDEAYKKLSEKEAEKKFYTVLEGDTIEKISQKTGSSISEIKKLNPNVTENSILKIGDKLLISKEKPFLSVKTIAKVSYNEDVPFKTDEVKNNKEYKNYKKVIQKGQTGEKVTTDEIVYIDGNETERKTIKAAIIKEPVNEKVEVGTLQEPVKKAVGNFKMPISGVLTSGFGSRWGTVHKGIDLAAPAGTPVHASDGGVVTFAGWNSGGYGNLVKISHENGYETYYAHNTSVAVSVGDRVYQGQVIAYVGSTGDSTGNHCHFEVRKDGVAYNPIEYLS